jgi:hypothetical protein
MVRGQTQQAGGADRLTARAQPADDNANGFLYLPIFGAKSGQQHARQQSKKRKVQFQNHTFIQ